MGAVKINNWSDMFRPFFSVHYNKIKRGTKMKASELIAALQSLINFHGDLEVNGFLPVSGNFNGMDFSQDIELELKSIKHWDHKGNQGFEIDTRESK